MESSNGAEQKGMDSGNFWGKSCWCQIRVKKRQCPTSWPPV